VKGLQLAYSEHVLDLAHHDLLASLTGLVDRAEEVAVLWHVVEHWRLVQVVT